MNIVVCAKHIPDPNISPQLDGYRLKRQGVDGVLDPGDEFSIEAGLQLREVKGGQVTLVSMGPAEAREALLRGLAMGADKGILITDEALQNADALVTARVLAEAIKRHGFDLVIAGVESTDGYTGTMASTLAEFLGVPQVTFIRRIISIEERIRAERQKAGGYQILESALPALISVTAGVNEPRYASLKGIMAARAKPIEEISLRHLGLSRADLTVQQRVTEAAPAPERKVGEVIENDGSAAGIIAGFLKAVKAI